MTLREYFFKYRILQKEFAKEVGCDSSYISAITNGKLEPGKRLAIDISKHTRGEVTIEDLRPNAKELRTIMTQ